MIFFFLDVEDSISLKIELGSYTSSKTLIGLTEGGDDPSVQSLWNAYQFQLNSSAVDWVDAVQAPRTITDYFLGLVEDTDVHYVNSRVMVGATFASSGLEPNKKVEATGWFNNQGYHTAPLSLNMIHNALLMQRTRNSSYRLSITNHPLPFDSFMKVEAANSKDGDGSIGFKIGNTLVLGMSFLAASFIIFLGSFILFCYHCLFDWCGTELFVFDGWISQGTSDQSQTLAVRFWDQSRDFLDGQLTVGLCQFHDPLHLYHDDVCCVQRSRTGVQGSV